MASKSFLPYLTLPLTSILLFFFSVFSIILLIKIILHPEIVKHELKDPLIGNFYARQPISAVILAILCMNLLPESVVLSLLIYGAVLIFALTIYLSYHFFSSINIKFDQLHGGWFITPVANILITTAVLQYPASMITLTIGLLFFGIGAILFLLILDVLFFRLISHTLPRAELAPTNYIILAPIGILIVDIIQIANRAGVLFGTNLSALSILAGMAFWGFGIWAIGINVLFFIKYIKSGLRFHLGWWGYVFPTATFTLGTIALSSSVSLFKTLSLLLYLYLVLVFAIVLLFSLRQLLGQNKHGKGRFRIINGV